MVTDVQAFVTGSKHHQNLTLTTCADPPNGREASFSERTRQGIAERFLRVGPAGCFCSMAVPSDLLQKTAAVVFPRNAVQMRSDSACTVASDWNPFTCELMVMILADMCMCYQGAFVCTRTTVKLMILDWLI